MKKILLAFLLMIPLLSEAQTDSVEFAGRSLVVRTPRYNHRINPVTSIQHNYLNNIITIRGGNGQVETMWAANIHKMIVNGTPVDFNISAFQVEAQKIVLNSTVTLSRTNPEAMAVEDEYSNETLGFINDKLPNLGPNTSVNSLSVTPATDILFPTNVTHVGNNAIAVNSGTSSNGTIRIIPATDAPTFGSTTAGTAPTRMQLQGSVFYTTAPTLTNGQSIAALGDANGRLLVNSVINGALTQTVTTIASANTSQTALATNANRRGFEIINTSASTLYISFNGAATTTSIPITAGNRYSRWEGKIPTNTITILGPSAGLTFTILEMN